MVFMKTNSRYGLKIKTDGGIDFLSLGAMVYRLDPGIIPFQKATECAIHVSGGEYNCAANLSNCFKLKTAITTALVNYPIGQLIAERVQSMGVKPFYKYFEHDGVHGPNMATVYSDRGYGIRGPVVFYNRSNEAAASLKPGDFDWKSIFDAGVRWFHSGGIFASLSETTGELIIQAFKAARDAGAITSFDLNFREKLWNVWGDPKKAQSILDRILEHVDVLLAGPGDLIQRLGVDEFKFSEGYVFDIDNFGQLMGHVSQKYPNIKVVATTIREIHSANHHTFSAIAWINGKTFTSPSCELDVLDRIGSGDGFASGLFYGLLSGMSEQDAVNIGWAHGALLHTFPGDTTMATLEQVKLMANGGTAGVQR
jgi:2-dehydro-3-deoxygluconokinase